MPSSKRRSSRRSVVVVGPFPPPVHGMSKNTANVAEELRSFCDVSIADISPRRHTRGLGYHATTVVKVLRALCKIATACAARDRRLYVPALAGLGMYYTIAIVALARLLGYKTFIHHRSFAYINRRIKRAGILVRVGGGEAVHIFLCPDMKRQFCVHYPRTRHCLIVSNARYVNPIVRLPESSTEGLCLGHLSNLGVEKGLDDVLETIRRLLAGGIKARLILAGPPTTSEDAQKIEAAKEEFGNALEYRGPVYGKDKDKFYSEIDVFLFPTRYVNEAQPNVVFEAMSFGVPSVTFARGCIAGDLAESGGALVPMSENFTEESLPILIAWERDRERLLMARKKALARATELRTMAETQHDDFIEMVAGKKLGAGTSRSQDERAD